MRQRSRVGSSVPHGSGKPCHRCRGRRIPIRFRWAAARRPTCRTPALARPRNVGRRQMIFESGRDSAARPISATRLPAAARLRFARGFEEFLVLGIGGFVDRDVERLLDLARSASAIRSGAFCLRGAERVGARFHEHEFQRLCVAQVATPTLESAIEWPGRSAAPGLATIESGSLGFFVFQLNASLCCQASSAPPARSCARSSNTYPASLRAAAAGLLAACACTCRSTRFCFVPATFNSASAGVT